MLNILCSKSDNLLYNFSAFDNNYDEILNHNKSIIRALDQIDRNNTNEEDIDKKIHSSPIVLGKD